MSRRCVVEIIEDEEATCFLTHPNRNGVVLDRALYRVKRLDQRNPNQYPACARHLHRAIRALAHEVTHEAS